MRPRRTSLGLGKIESLLVETFLMSNLFCVHDFPEPKSVDDKDAAHDEEEVRDVGEE